MLCLAGCAGSGKVTLFPDGHVLEEDTRVLREVSAAPEGIGRELDKHPAEPYRVEPGDILLVQPVELASPLRLPGDQPVLPDGTIRLGPLGTLPVMNRTVEEIQAAVNELAERQRITEKIVVRLVARESKVFYVLGEVNAPGAFQLKGRETVLDALLSAGGLNTNASRHKIILTRPTAPDGCRIVLPVDYNAIAQRGDTTTNYQIRAGDRVFVPTKSKWEGWEHLFGGKPGCTASMPCWPRGGVPAP